MASPSAAEMPNGISTPPTTATGGGSGTQNQSPPAGSATQPNTQNSQPLLTNGNGTSSSSTAAPQSQIQSQTATTSINPSFPATSLQDSGTSKRPRDARLIHLVLANMGVHAYTERVPLQLLDFSYRYTNGIITDALAYEPPAPSSKKSKNADDEGVSLNALRTAVGSRAANQFSPTLPKEYMAELAAERNRIALPRVEREFGLRLPPERYCFTGVGWDLKREMELEMAEDEDEDENGQGEAMDVSGAVEGIGMGGPVGGSGGGAGDTVMGGMEDEEQDEDEFEEAMGLKAGE